MTDDGKLTNAQRNQARAGVAGARNIGTKQDANKLAAKLAKQNDREIASLASPLEKRVHEATEGITGRSQYIPFWTDISDIGYNSYTQEPVQKHKFFVDMLLYKGTLTSDGRIKNVHSWRPAYHLIKAIDLPTMALASLENKAAPLNSNDAVVLQGSNITITDLTVTFYLTRSLAKNLRSTFFAYFAQFPGNTDKNEKPTGKSERVVFSNLANGTLAVNEYFRSRSRIIVTLFNSQVVPQLGEPAFIDINQTPITYYNITPISLDLGEMAYGESEMVEAKMVFNVGSIGIGEAIVTSPPPPNKDGLLPK